MWIAAVLAVAVAAPPPAGAATGTQTVAGDDSRGTKAPAAVGDDSATTERGTREITDALEARHSKFLAQLLAPRVASASLERIEDHLAEYQSLDRGWEVVGRRGIPRWTVTALTRQAELARRVADLLAARPVPPEVARLGAEAVASFREVQGAKVAELRATAQNRDQRSEAFASQSGVPPAPSAAAHGPDAGR